MFKAKLPTSLLLFAIALVSTLLIHACSLGNSNALKPLRVGISTWPGFDVALYAKEAGLFQKRGLVVEFVRFQNQQDSARAVLRGSLDAAFGSLWDIMQVDPGGDNPVFVMVTNISHGADGMVTRSGIGSVKELKGKRVAAKLGTINHLILLEALKRNGMKPTDVQIVDISRENAAYLLQQNRLDGVVTWEPILSQIAKDVQGTIVFTTQEVDSLVIDGLVSRSSLVNSKKSELKQFILAWFDLMQAVDSKPAEVFASVGKQLGQSGDAFASDYAGLKKGDLAMNQRMFQPQGRLQEAAGQMVQLLREDSRHGRIVREDVEINANPVTAAIEEWKA